MVGSGLTFELVPRRRVNGLPFGAMRSSRRGLGSEPAATRPYRAGDDTRRIDRYATARLSAAYGRDELVVRDPQSEEAARVVVAIDSSPSMLLYPPELPWLQKPIVTACARELIEASAARLRCPVDAVSAAGPVAAMAAFGRKRSLPPGSFVFVVSDFLAPLPARAWRPALARGWDVVPVVVQDACWEQSFPAVGGALLPVAEPGSGRVVYVRLTRREAEERRVRHEARRERLLALFRGLGVDPVLLADHDPAAVSGAFQGWAERRRSPRRAAA